MHIDIGDILVYTNVHYYKKYSIIVCVGYDNRGGSWPLTELLSGESAHVNGYVLTPYGCYISPTNYEDLEKLINIFDYRDDELEEFKAKMDEMGVDFVELWNKVQTVDEDTYES